MKLIPTNITSSLRPVLNRCVLTVCLALFIAHGATAAAGGWTHFCGDARRTSTRPNGPVNLNAVAWVAPPQLNEEFIASSSPLTWSDRVYVTSRLFGDSLHINNRLVCLNSTNGARLWDAPLPTDTFDSWSSAVVYDLGHAVIVPVGNKLIAIDAISGSFLWQAVLSRSVVNASPVVSHDLAVGGMPANRCFITDYSVSITQPFGRLYAINIDAYDAVNNPYLQGDIVWQRVIGRTIGNTPAYRDGRVYVATASGSLLAYDAVTSTQQWSQPVSGAQFMGGVTVTDEHVYAGSYSFDAQGLLVKVRADNGYLEWVTACERTAANPIVCKDRIYVSGGLDGFGSVVNLQAFEDEGHCAELIWETDTGFGGPYRVGGWNAQPALAGHCLYVSRPSLNDFFSHFTHLVQIDLEMQPGDPGFIVSEHAGAGGPPALHGGRAYSVGVDGLVAFHMRAPSPGSLGGEQAGILYP